jgi:hypothetical protein
MFTDDVSVYEHWYDFSYIISLPLPSILVILLSYCLCVLLCVWVCD